MSCKKCMGDMELKSINTEVYRISIVEYKCQVCGHIKSEYIPREPDEKEVRIMVNKITNKRKNNFY